MLLGSEGRLLTVLGAAECSRRIQADIKSFRAGSRVDQAGFRLAERGRSSLRVLGTFALQPDGRTLITYRFDIRPATWIALAVSLPFAVVVMVVFLQSNPATVGLLWIIIPGAVLLVAANIWLSNVHAGWMLRALVQRLEASPFTLEYPE